MCSRWGGVQSSPTHCREIAVLWSSGSVIMTPKQYSSQRKAPKGKLAPKKPPQWKPINQTHCLPSKCFISRALIKCQDHCLHVLLKGNLMKLWRSPWKGISAFCLPASLCSHLCHSLAVPMSRIFIFFSGLQ